MRFLSSLIGINSKFKGSIGHFGLLTVERGIAATNTINTVYPSPFSVNALAGNAIGHELESPDCRLALLPGDDLYPKNLDQLEERGVILSTEKSFEQLQRESAALHRAVFSDLYTVAVHMNITPKYKHLRPIGAPSQTRSPRPKL
ncbi:acyl-coenzyme A diphosphatase NUDT19-like [Conger conger]|uniref:acyl-coenzyme A diphosphatase NUDT19-like n=1 Tax=Conger conger TaxID=82655 RepID=UPI002A5A4EAA|nr:acyl-coenzyme A diphosphatase NUDT19-like [Conger conger]